MKKAQRAFLTFLTATLSIIFITACSDHEKAAKLIDKAQSHYDTGNLGAAEIELKNALREDQSNAQAIALTGKIYNKQGRLREAYHFLQAAVNMAPDDAESLSMLAGIKLAAGIREEALADAKKALSLDSNLTEAPMVVAELANSKETALQTIEWLESLPPNASIQTAIGSLKLKTGKIKEAGQHFDKAIQDYPSSPLGHAGRFQILLSQKKQEEAEAAFQKAAELASPRSSLKIRYVQYLQNRHGDDVARKALNEILSAAPDYLPALGMAAELAAKHDELKRARDWVNQALMLDPIDPTALRVNGTLLILEQKTDEAIHHLEKMLELYPKDAKANYQIALAYLSNRETGKAKLRLSRVVEQVPGHFEANALLSSIQVQEEDYPGAIITLESFLRANPNSMQGHLLLAEVYNRKGENAKAVAIYQRLEKNQPENPQLDYLSGMSYLKGQNKQNARESFESALASDPLHFQSVEQLTVLDVGERNFDQALERINQTIAVSPDTSMLHTIRAQILLSKGETDKALKSFEKSIELDGKNRTARTLYARTLRSLNRADEAADQYQAITENSPNDLGALTALATLHEEKQRFSNAVELYEKMLAIDENYVPALNNLAYLYSTRFDEAERAFQLAQKAREQTPTSPFTADTLGWIVHKRGDYSWARSLLSDSYSQLGDNAEVAYHLGSTEYMLGNIKDAQRLLDQAASSDKDFAGKGDAISKLEILALDPQQASEENKAFLTQYLSKNPADPIAKVIQGKILKNEGNPGEAIARFREAIQIAPSNLQAQLNLATVLLEDGLLEEAQELLKTASTQKPEASEVSFLQGKLALAQNNYKWALSLFQKSGTTIPSPELAYYLGKTYYSLGQKTNAQKQLAKAQTKSPESPQEHSVNAMVSILNIDTYRYSPQAESRVEQHLEEYPNDAQALATLATLELRNNELESAKDRFQRAIDLASDNLTAKLGLAEIQINDSSNAANVYAIATEARDEPTEANRSNALIAIALHQQGKTDLSKQQSNSLSLEKLPENLRSRVITLLEK